MWFIFNRDDILPLNVIFLLVIVVLNRLCVMCGLDMESGSHLFFLRV